jgi:tRNA pseudouridine32 synthase/23S rRNA pseudouridine746 synthase
VIEKEYEALAPHLHGAIFRSLTAAAWWRATSSSHEGSRGRAEFGNADRCDRAARRLTLYRLLPHTGRQHQLRVHLAALGIPIVNDAFYPVALPCKQDDVSQPLQLLARRIAFDDPLTGERREFFSRRSL